LHAKRYTLKKTNKNLAIFSFKHHKNKRASGANVINKVAYRLRTKATYTDFETGEIINRYHKPNDNEQIIDLGVYGAPKHLQDPFAWAKEIEKSENRKNSTVCREFMVALPRELSIEEMKKAVNELIEKTITKHSMTAHATIHYSKNNPHVHILFSEKLFNNKTNKFGKKSRIYTAKGTESLNYAREAWATIANEYLEPHSVKISHLSHEDRGITEIEPTKPVGHHSSTKNPTPEVIQHNKIQTDKRNELLETDFKFNAKYLGFLNQNIIDYGIQKYLEVKTFLKTKSKPPKNS
jgi:hypothetical protein